MSNKPWEARTAPIPSVRKDVDAPVARIRPESVGKSHLVGSYGTGGNADYGDFEMVRKKGETTRVPEYSPVDTAHPVYQQLMKQYNSEIRSGEAPLFHPTDYLEHHHDPGEEFAPLPWES